MTDRRLDLLLCLTLVGLAAILFLTGAPTGGAFSWPDSPRHALNGAFILDLVSEMPFHDPRGWAYNYYGQYPAVTVLLYPPLYPAILAFFYGLFGVSQATALLVNFLFYSALGWGAYKLARLYFGAAVSFGVALTLIGAPESTYWGRQVMTEVPAFAILTWSALALCLHLRSGKSWLLFASVLLLLAAIYIKMSVAFIIPVFALVAWRKHGSSILQRHDYWLAFAFFVIGLMPVIWLTINFGQANVESVQGVSDRAVSRASIEGWVWYAEQLPSQLGWPALLSAIAGIGFVLARWRRLDREALWLFGGWLVCGYLFFSAIDLKEARHSIFLLLPMAFAAGYACETVFRDRRLGGAVAVLLGVTTLAISVVQRPVHYVDGYSEVVAFVSEHAPRETNILFSGYRDGSFIFAMRASGKRPDLNTLRADKLLLRIAVRRELGVEQTAYSEKQIAALLTQHSISYVVAQPDFWTDLDQMLKLQDVLRSDRFEEVARFDMRANYPAQEHELVVYRNLASLPSERSTINIELPIIDSSIETSE